MTCPECGAETYRHRLLSTARDWVPACTDCPWLGVGRGDARRSFVEVER